MQDLDTIYTTVSAQPQKASLGTYRVYFGYAKYMCSKAWMLYAVCCMLGYIIEKRETVTCDWDQG